MQQPGDQSEEQAFLRLMALARHDPAAFEHELDEAAERRDGTADVERVMIEWPEYGRSRITFTGIALARGDYRLAQRVLQAYQQLLRKKGGSEGDKEMRYTLRDVSYDEHASDLEIRNKLDFLRAQDDGEQVFADAKTSVFKNVFMSRHLDLAEQVLRSGGVDVYHSGFPEDDAMYWHARVDGWAALYADEVALRWLLRNGIDPWSATAPTSGSRLVDYLDAFTRQESRACARPRFEEFVDIGRRLNH